MSISTINMSPKVLCVACVFCGSNHPPTNIYTYCYCSYSKLKHLESMMDCMEFEECPNFNNYPINELRFIAFYYAGFKKAIPPSQMIPFGNRYNRAFGYAPIPLTLSKNRTVKALVDRWKGFSTFRINKSLSLSPDVDYVDCAICLEHISCYKWNNRNARVDEFINNEVPSIITICNHKFCTRCWDRLIQTPTVFNGSRAYVKCPLCRCELLIAHLL